MNSNKLPIIETLEKETQKYLKDLKDLENKGEDTAELKHKIWNLSKERFIIKTRTQKDLKSYGGMIFTIGFTPEPIILNILANKPTAVFFIYTEASQEVLNQIIKDTGIEASQYKRELMGKDTMLDSISLVKKGLAFLEKEKKIDHKKIALDPTGGTKVMSVGCGIAASIFNIDILYVSNESYDPVSRRPVPGTEVLINVPNLLTIYNEEFEQTKIPIDFLHKQLFKEQNLSKEEVQEKFAILFEQIAKKTKENTLRYNDLDIGKILANLIGVFVLQLPKPIETLEKMLLNASRYLINLLNFKIEGTGTIATLWNKHVSTKNENLTSEVYLTNISLFFNELFQISKENKLYLYPDEIAQMISFIIFSMAIQQPQPVYHCDKISDFTLEHLQELFNVRSTFHLLDFEGKNRKDIKLDKDSSYI